MQAPGSAVTRPITLGEASSSGRNCDADDGIDVCDAGVPQREKMDNSGSEEDAGGFKRSRAMCMSLASEDFFDWSPKQTTGRLKPCSFLSAAGWMWRKRERQRVVYSGRLRSDKLKTKYTHVIAQPAMDSRFGRRDHQTCGFAEHRVGAGVGHDTDAGSLSQAMNKQVSFNAKQHFEVQPGGGSQAYLEEIEEGEQHCFEVQGNQEEPSECASN